MLELLSLRKGHDADQGDVPQSSLWRPRRAGAEDHRRLHLQAAQEADLERLRLATTTSTRSGAAATCCAIRTMSRPATSRKRSTPDQADRGAAECAFENSRTGAASAGFFVRTTRRRERRFPSHFPRSRNNKGSGPAPTGPLLHTDNLRRTGVRRPNPQATIYLVFGREAEQIFVSAGIAPGLLPRRRSGAGGVRRRPYGR